MADHHVLQVGILFLFCVFMFSDAGRVPGIYVFGDSLVDVGNNNYLKFSFAKANFPHNGIDFPTRKPTGRFGNGKNAADLLAERVGLPTAPPFLSLVSKKNHAQFQTGVNFGSGASGIISQENNIIQKLQSISLPKQVDFFLSVNSDLKKKLGAIGAQKHLSKSLFVIESGSNDIYSYFEPSDNSQNKTTPEQYINLMALTFKKQIKRLYNVGARKFVIVGIGLVGCTPAERNGNKAGNCNEEINNLSVKYNGVLISILKALKSELKNINYSYFDGFTEVKAACCGLGNLNADAPCLPFSTYCSNRSNHLFWDRSHPTEAAHRIFVDYIFDGPSLYTFPLNVRKLIAI
ncbi:hypothetical protein FEM48_Zijuj01G0233500 [Ziziphus jujuba var. spinosa]|uniref:GDSL esterase/lipase At5g55050-like n=1 Tax=Ziziphus jujuba var. spinosa TaxID=714518 RepID=A0A978W456_ZIZJJ|nr:hypothetical protein FEM48_Zijuj01G0233500 [Ziziphus jujuba var. spinosa]